MSKLVDKEDIIMSEFNFNSQVCTDKNQSERLLSLGLKKETADCYLFEYEKEKYKVIAESWLGLIADEKYYSQYKDVCFPAWSPHRLWKLMPKVVFSERALHLTMCGDSIFYCTEDNNEDYEKPFSAKLNLYDNIIDSIEWLIKEGYFNKEYLV